MPKATFGLTFTSWPKRWSGCALGATCRPTSVESSSPRHCCTTSPSRPARGSSRTAALPLAATPGAAPCERGTSSGALECRSPNARPFAPSSAIIWCRSFSSTARTPPIGHRGQPDGPLRSVGDHGRGRRSRPDLSRPAQADGQIARFREQAVEAGVGEPIRIRIRPGRFVYFRDAVDSRTSGP